jgi:hypothetical protein
VIHVSEIFVSHSSIDKHFVRKVAVDMLQEGLPIWLDEWELDIGDSLIERIYAGIDAGSYFILVMSKASIASGWVTKEMTAALVKEEQLSRRFLIPILIDESKPPLAVADRLYADFSKDYTIAFEKLVRRLKLEGLHKIVPSANRIVIPLLFAQDTHLDTRALQTRVDYLRPALQAGRRLAPKDFYVCTSPQYQALRAKLVHRMEHIADDSFYSPEFELEFKNYYRGVVDLEQKYPEGVCLILNNLVLDERSKHFGSLTAYESFKWYSLLWRSALLNSMFKARNPNEPNRIEYGGKCINDRFETDAGSYGLAEERLAAMDVGPLKRDQRMFESFRVYIDRNLGVYKDTEYLTIEPLLSYVGSLLWQYVIPQMTAQMVAGFSGPYSWTFEGYGIGRG